MFRLLSDFVRERVICTSCFSHVVCDGGVDVYIHLEVLDGLFIIFQTSFRVRGGGVKAMYAASCVRLIVA